MSSTTSTDLFLSAQAQANPTDMKLAAKVNAMFKGETLRGLLLNAYAFGTMATLAGIAAVVTVYWLDGLAADSDADLALLVGSGC
jgi:hypothetical protein